MMNTTIMDDRQILVETNLFIQSVQLFYQKNPRWDSDKKMDNIRLACTLIAEINSCKPYEIPSKVIGMHRLLTSLLPYLGYPEREELNTKLSQILYSCRALICAH
jgi:hypothetical protein